jgi:hypothetical protein
MQLVARNLRQARLVSTGGRGRGGARQQPLHVAHMIIAACAANQVADVAGTVLTFANLELSDSTAPRKRGRAGGDGEHAVPRELQFATRRNVTLGAVVAGLVDMAANGGLYSLLMNHAAEFVDRDLLRAGADAIKHAPRGKKPEATAELAAKMVAHVQTLIDQSAVYLNLSFLRPLPGALVEFGTQHEGETTRLLRVQFGLPAAFLANPRTAPKLSAWRRMDRSHQVTISHRTLLSIGQAIAAEEGA